MKLNLRHIIPAVVLFFIMSINVHGQASVGCDQTGYVPCGPNHECKPRNQCGGQVPPPPGLVVPIDNNLSFLLAAGLGLGIYFFVSSGRRSTSTGQ